MPKYSTLAHVLFASSLHITKCQPGLDIYGNATRLDPSHSIFLDKTNCKYTAKIQFNFPRAKLPFPPISPGPEGPGSCNLEESSCEGKSCLFEVRNVYRFDNDFKEITGFDHVGFDWSPCGHPPLDKFGRPHINMHIFRISPEERQTLTCDMLDPFICKFPPKTQSTIAGKKFFVIGSEAGSKRIVNAPENYTYQLDSALPGEGLHAFNNAAAAPVLDWFNPLLIMGLYDGQISFWESMFPAEFVSGEMVNSYSESVTYVSQTIVGLPFYWSMDYDPDSGFTTLTMEGNAEKCESKSTYLRS